MEHRVAVFPGSFDPFTVGHESVVNRGLAIFDKIIISIGYNINKQGFSPVEQRIEWINNVFGNNPKVEVQKFTGLTVDFCKDQGAGYILRGLRTAADFEYERAIAQINKAMSNGIESVFLLTMPEHTMVTSTIVRDILRHGGDASKFLPASLDISANQYKLS